MSDKEILLKAKRGDESVLDYLYKKYFRMCTKLVESNSGTPDEAKDIYQEALLVFWQKASAGSLILTSKISTYLFSICQNQWRKELVLKSRMSTKEVEVSYTSEEFELEERSQVIKNCIDSLGETCKNLLSYYYYDGMNMNEIAKKMNFANTDTAKTKKYKCKKRLDLIVRSKYTKEDFFDL